MSTLFDQLKKAIEEYNECLVNESTLERSTIIEDERNCIERKKQQLKDRGAEIVKSTVDGNFLGQQKFDTETQIEYILHHQHLTRIKDQFYIEECLQRRKAIFEDGQLINDFNMYDERIIEDETAEKIERELGREFTERYTYNRLEAVRYAERWWDSRNPAYKNFNDNCTNFISQCLRAGGAPMTGYPNRSKGWWYRDNNWSFSWSVAHSFRWYLSGAKSGLRGREVSSADQLQPGDVICYDFDGNGRWQHTTIVVDKDANNEPLVNAHTADSRMRYWAYEDSTAWTPNIKYKFFQIVDGS